MFSPNFHRTFGVTHPLGLPRPIDSENLFGARIDWFVWNMMPIPGGCLAHFDAAVYRPYVRNLVKCLKGLESGWSGPAESSDPPRYCLLRNGVPSTVPMYLRTALPLPPRVSFEQVLTHFDRRRPKSQAMQLLDVLTMVGEDMGPARFAAATEGRKWVAEYMR